MSTDSNIHPTAIIGNARIGKHVKICEYVVIRDGVTIGDGCVLHPHVVIEEGVTIGERVEIFPGSMLGKEPRGAGATARSARATKGVRVGNECSIGPHATVFQDVEIGSNTLIGDGASIREECRIGSRCILSRCVTLNYNVRVGDGSKVMDLTHLTGNCVVGEGVFISIHVSTTNDNALGRSGYVEGDIRGPTFGDHSVIGANSVILPAVAIGARALVAAGSVVTRDVPAGSRVFGSPARVRLKAGEEP
jgi:acetyltransferase-like isoleucine patch superfamily enzyme